MKSIVIYFSQTGNTEKVARAIQAGITQVTAQCDLQEIRDTNPLRLKDYDLIGLGSPVFGGCPKNVLQFVRHLRFVGGKHAFSFCTHGTMHEGFYAHSLPGARGPGSHRHRLGRLVRGLLPPAHAAALPDGGTSGCDRPRRGRGLRQRDGRAQHAHPGWGNRSHTPCPCAPCSAPVCSSRAKRRRSACGRII